MAIDQDPYRTLGLARGASLDEIKRAYRRLAKIHHPDAAGERNVPRFLAIQAAYEQLAGGIPGGLPGQNGSRRPSGTPRRPWEADPDRSDATRRAYGGRGRGAAPGTGSPGGAGAAGTSRPAGGPSTGGSKGAAPGSARPGARPAEGGAAGGPAPRASSTRTGSQGTTGSGGARRGRAAGAAGAAGEAGAAGAAGGAGQAGTSSGQGTSGSGASGAPPRAPRDRKKNKATLGSTSYDGVDGPFEPDWRGASWYGTTSGTYWTLNPKEYAVPRKHGPEYQARARRATRSRTPDEGGPATAFGPATTSANDPIPDEPAEGPEATARPTHTTSSWWESTGGPAEAVPSIDEAPRARPASQGGPPPVPPDLGLALANMGRALVDPGFGGQRGRVMRALLGWLPIAFGVSWFVGEMTGCGRFAATCTDFADPMTLVIQVIALAVLLLFPLAGSIAAMAAVVLLGAAVIAALILSATGAAADTDLRRSALGAVLLIAWLAGIGLGVTRRVRHPPSTARPVS